MSTRKTSIYLNVAKRMSHLH